jgi:tetratricopeptide (TPR) repeat protein
MADNQLRDAASLIGEATGEQSIRAVAGHVAYDHAEVCYTLGRNEEAARHIRVSRVFNNGHPAELIKLDILEGRLEHMQGQFNKAAALYETALNAAKTAGSLSEEALASNYMGNAARDSGRYEEAESFFTHALGIWMRTGMTEAIAGAHNNLANLAISRGDHIEASRHYGEALDAFEKIGNNSGRATALMNLAIVAIENDDPTSAISIVETARGLLEASGNKALLGLANVIKGEALVEANLRDEAMAMFQQVIASYSETTHPLALAGAHRGAGRVQLVRGLYQDAIQAFERALVLYERLHRVQEAARTELCLAHALGQSHEWSRAKEHLEHARHSFVTIGAARDLERAEAMCQSLDQQHPASS